MDQQLLLKACKGSFVGDERADTGLISQSFLLHLLLLLGLHVLL